MDPRPPSPSLLAGITAAFRGLHAAWSAPDVGRAYLHLASALLITTLTLDLGGLATLWHVTATAGEASLWASVGQIALRVIGVVVVLFVAPVLALVIVNNAAPLLSERVFLAGLATVAPERAQVLAARPGLPFLVSLRTSLLRLAWFFACSLSTLLLSFVPVAGAILSPVLQGFFSARAMAWELLDPYFDKLEYDFRTQRRYVRDHRAAIFGFGLPLSFTMAVPLFGPWLFALAQAAAGRFVGEVLEAPSRAATEPAPAPAR